MKKLIAIALSAALLAPVAADAQSHRGRHNDWQWQQRNRNVFATRGQCQRALVRERNLARRDARQRGFNFAFFNQRWRLHCDAFRRHGRTMYRIV